MHHSSARRRHGKPVTTIEGLEIDGKLHPLQEAFIHADAMQCGYCTPGMIMSGVALLRDNPAPDEAQIKRSLEGNVCRCGTFIRALSPPCAWPASRWGEGTHD